MGIFSRSNAVKGPSGVVLPNWALDPIVLQDPYDLAHTPPDWLALVRQVVEEAGQGSPQIAFQRLLTMLAFQIDYYVSQSPDLQKYDFEAIRNQLMSRPDFHEHMLYATLTYFGPKGMAMHNGLVDMTPAFLGALEQAAREGHLGG